MSAKPSLCSPKIRVHICTFFPSLTICIIKNTFLRKSQQLRVDTTAIRPVTFMRQWKQYFWREISKNFQDFTHQKIITFQNAQLEDIEEGPSSYILVGHIADRVRVNLRSLMWQNDFSITKTSTVD